MIKGLENKNCTQRKHHMLRKFKKDTKGKSKEVTTTKLSRFNLIKLFPKPFIVQKLTCAMQQNI